MLGITVKTTSMRRLYALYLFLCKAEDDGFVSRTACPDDLKGQCVLGFSSMQVHQPAFNEAVRLSVSTTIRPHLDHSNNQKPKYGW